MTAASHRGESRQKSRSLERHASRSACASGGCGCAGRSPRSGRAARRRLPGSPRETRAAAAGRVGAGRPGCARGGDAPRRRGRGGARCDCGRQRRRHGGGRREARRRRRAPAETLRRAATRERATTARTRPRGGLAAGAREPRPAPCPLPRPAAPPANRSPPAAPRRLHPQVNTRAPLLAAAAAPGVRAGARARVALEPVSAPRRRRRKSGDGTPPQRPQRNPRSRGQPSALFDSADKTTKHSALQLEGFLVFPVPVDVDDIQVGYKMGYK